ncbi:MAG: hypothetical protein IT564_11505 [Rhodospirillales bacterium]|nr:hypothetical protein [Rhodospirillales bacterium]
MFTITASTVTTSTGRLTYWLHQPEHTLAASQALLLTFASTRQSAFYEAPQDIPARLFAAAGHAVVSFDLPHHGEQIKAFGQGIDGFCAAFCAGADPFVQFVEQGRTVIDACLAQGLGKGGIVACGVSRAAYCALRLAAADQRISGVAGLAPVTDWRVLREFTHVHDQPAIAALALDHYAEHLAGRALFLAIGNADLRVSSAACLRFGAHLLKLEEAASTGCSTVELHLVNAVGHSLDEQWRRAGANFLLNHVTQRQQMHPGGSRFTR